MEFEQTKQRRFSLMLDFGKKNLIGLKGPEATTKVVQQACPASMPWNTVMRGNELLSIGGRMRLVFYEHRRRCARMRRRRGPRTEEVLAEFKDARKTLKVAIIQSKQRKWEELRHDMDPDPWRLGYKVVMQKVGLYKPLLALEATLMQDIVTKLFPACPRRKQKKWDSLTVPIPFSRKKNWWLP
ncbi:uncharacterized protein [Rhodnius prolixus]|uniref:uncharacterized protein n=1 Tax=Rhodnius prolixus TaxID=13249 RepID=UPI003D18CE93